MNGSYQPFPIYDFRSGLHLDKKPWLIPKDAYSKLVNAYLYQGVLQKRRGTTEWGRVVYFVDDEALGVTVDLQLTYSGTLNEQPLRPGDLIISTSGGGETFTDQGDGTLSGSSGGSGTIVYTTGAWSITYNANPGGGKSITADYNYFPGNPVMGIWNYYSSAGGSHLLVFDTKRWNKYNTTTKVLEDIDEADIWTGSDSQFFWTENWKDKLFICNNKDQARVYDGESMALLNMDIDDDTFNEVDCCLFFIVHKDRLIALRTTEDGQIKPTRARWCVAGEPLNWKEVEGGGFTDAPTIDWIMGVEFIGDDIIVWFERSVWILKYTANPVSPFRWQRIESTEGSYAPFSTVSFADEVLTMGPTSILACDGFTVYNIDKKIPDFLLDTNPEKLHYSFGAVAEELRQTLWTYAPRDQAYAKEILALNYGESSWATYKLHVHCLGYYKCEEDLIWDDIDETWDEIEWAWDERGLTAGFPIMLGGTYDGRIIQLDKGGSDCGSSIELEIEGGKWNPYVEKGQKAKLGYIEFLVDRDPNISITVKFYLDQQTLPYKTETLVFDGPEDEERVWKRIYCGGVVASFHRINISHNAIAQTPKFHAWVPWFRPAGRLI